MTLSVIVSAGLAAWLVLCVANQVAPTAMLRVAKYDAFALLPNWRFFSPIPKKADTLVAARTWTDGRENPGDWSIISPPFNFAPWTFIFHPRSRVQKATGDLTGFLLQHVGSLKGDEAKAYTVLGILPYTVLLSYAHTECQLAQRNIDKVQFAVIDAFGDLDTPRVLFMSEPHDV